MLLTEKQSMRHHATRRCCLIVCLLIAGLSSVHAKTDANESEFKLLPRYCPDTMFFGGYGDAYSHTSPRAAYWVSLMGDSFWHMHHYCLALLNMVRAQKASLTQYDRSRLWKNAHANYQYVIDHAESGFIMLPEIYTRIGDVELLLAHPDKANEAFARARELKPDYWPAYSHWSEFLIKIGKRPEALRVVAAGLRHSPNARVLLEQFQLLGGKPSDIPKPVEKPQAPTTQAADASASPPVASDTPPAIAPEPPVDER